ncbi:GNAT family N-acetyltransferase [Streptomyces sp. DSM 44917]|uniref:GNAT family N-acetyltransferase n=1 Tax=Streptomyces boetiae TaxID=3075541 RepID=A0ABU2L355_9ACTN|nr:GNAT family N-acetyltransferase [Streptomyces sp. DSM 44917]MDT0306001.1 GNAT family N-acetyltransferase [Streptomyces sp. DSM 44917]
MRPDVRLAPLDHDLLDDLLATAVADADPLEVMPPVEGPPGWTSRRREAFLAFHRSRGLAAEPVEATYAVLEGTAVAGAARLCPLPDPGPGRRAAEAGLWLGRSHRGVGVGGAVLPLLCETARRDGFTALYLSTTPDNAPVRRLLARLDATPEADDTHVTAWLDLRTGP